MQFGNVAILVASNSRTVEIFLKIFLNDFKKRHAVPWNFYEEIKEHRRPAMADKFTLRHRVEPSLSEHARRRMSGRSINTRMIDQVLRYGRECHTRHATIYAVGHREIKEHGRFLEECAGIHVLCSSDGTVITTYRNHDLRGLRR